MINEKFSEQEIVRLKRDIKSAKLVEGDFGTILAIHESNPTAYEVEFYDRDGKSLALLTLTEDDFSKKGIVEISTPYFLLALHLIEVSKPIADSIDLEVEIRIRTLKGTLWTSVWMKELINFVNELKALKEKKSKRARLNSLSPGEFELSVEIDQYPNPHDYENWTIRCSLWDAMYFFDANLSGRFDIGEFLFQTLMNDFQKLLNTIQQISNSANKEFF